MRRLATLITFDDEEKIETLKFNNQFSITIKEFDEIGRDLILIFGDKVTDQFIADIKQIRKERDGGKSD